MHWLKRDIWKAGIAVAGLLILLVFMVWVPASNVGAHEGASGLATPVTGTATPTVDTTVTALSKEQLNLQVKQLQNQNNWLVDNSTALIAATATVVVALFGILQWAITVRHAQNKELRDREDERKKEIAAQDKDLRAQAEERFKIAVTALGDEKESTQIGGAILLRSFLNKDDEEIYGRYYTQIFDLAVAYLRPSSTSQPPVDPDRISPAPEPLPLTTLRQALIVVFKEAFPLARKKALRFLDATRILLDHAYLVGADLKQVSMSSASLQMADLSFAQLEGAILRGVQLELADLVGARLKGANLTVAQLKGANFNDAQLEEVYLRGSHLEGAHFRGAQLKGAWFERAILSDADLSGANPEEARSLKDTNLRGVKGLTKEQLELCKAKGAIIDDDTTTNPPQSTVASSQTSQSNDIQAPAASPAQVNTPPDTDGSSVTASQPSADS